MANPLEIRCAVCKRVTLARAEPVYEEFRKVADAFVCTACGHRYASREATPFVAAEGRPRVFSEADKPAAAKVFKAGERRHTCGWCRHFIVNPFSQRCGLRNREVEATDECLRFTLRPETAAEAAAKPPAATDAASRFDALFGGAPAAGAAADGKTERKTEQKTEERKTEERKNEEPAPKAARSAASPAAKPARRKK